MTKIATFFIALSAISLGTAVAQDADFKYEKVLYNDKTIDAEEYSVKISNVVSNAVEAKFKLEITNKTADFLLFDATKCTFQLGGNKLAPTDKLIILEPYDSKSKTISVTGTALNTHKTYTFNLGGIQRVVPLSTVENIPSFKLPASKNDFSAGPFNVQLKNFKKESGATFAKFDVQYRGDKIGFIYPSKIDVKMPDGNNYANADMKGKAFLMFPGDAEKFSANWSKMPGGRENDMQLVDMNINFTGVFAEGVAKDLAQKSIEIDWNEANTNAAK
jgi:hypothetical protein